MAAAVGVLMDHQAHLVHLDPLAILETKAFQAEQVNLPKKAILEELDHQAREEPTELTANQAQQAKLDDTPKLVREAKLVTQVPKDHQAHLATTPKKDILVEMAILVHQVPLALTATQADLVRKVNQEDLVNAVSQARMLSTVLARVVLGLRRLKPKLRLRLRPRPRPKPRRKLDQLVQYAFSGICNYAKHTFLYCFPLSLFVLCIFAGAFYHSGIDEFL